MHISNYYYYYYYHHFCYYYKKNVFPHMSQQTNYHIF